MITQEELFKEIDELHIYEFLNYDSKLQKVILKWFNKEFYKNHYGEHRTRWSLLRCFATWTSRIQGNIRFGSLASQIEANYSIYRKPKEYKILNISLEKYIHFLKSFNNLLDEDKTELLYILNNNLYK